jgi:tape measure domain-containing protein
MTVAELTAKVAIIGVDKAKGQLKQLSDGLKSVASSAAVTGTAMAGLAIGAGAVGVAIKTAIDYDSQVRGLAGYSRNAQELEAQLARLKEIAKLPGLGLNEVRQGVLNMEAAGFSAQEAEANLMAFGNALGLVGKGKAELNGVTTALTQIASKGQLSAEEVNQLAERVPQVRMAIKKAFGTSSAEEITKMGYSGKQAVMMITAEMAKLPKMSQSALTSWENLTDGLQAALLPVGRGILDLFSAAEAGGGGLLEYITNVAKSIGEVFSAMATSGVFTDFVKELFGDIGEGGDVGEGFARFAANIMAFLVEFPKVVRDTIKQVVFHAQLGIMRLVATLANIASKIPFIKNTDFAKGATGFGMAADAREAMGPGDLEGGNIGAKADEYYNRIMGYKREQGLPPGLQFGGPVTDDGGSKSPVEAILGKIADNTKEAADQLSLRRQTLGGGAMGALGVSSAEMAGGASSAVRFGDFMGGGGGLIPAGTDLERAIRRMVRDEGRKGGGPGLMKRF